MMATVWKRAANVARNLPQKRLLKQGNARSIAHCMVKHPCVSAIRIRSFHHSALVNETKNDEDLTKDTTESLPIDEIADDEDDDEGISSEKYLGVTYHADRIKKWSASATVGQIEVDAGQFWTEEDAAKGYDELVRMYLEPGTPLNFPDGHEDEDAETTTFDWNLPDAGSKNADIIPPIRNTDLTMEELIPALEREQAIDIYTIDLAGKSSLASHMVFCTGRSRNHMRRMADMVIISMKAREMTGDFEYLVEGRDCDDWMIADINNIVVHFMTAETRKLLQLEDHWENMVDDKHRLYGNLSEDEYMDKYGMSGLITEEDFIPEEDIDHSVWK